MQRAVTLTPDGAHSRRDIFHVLQNADRRFGSSIAATEVGTRNVVTYHDLYRRACGVASSLIDRGVGRGDRVAVVMRNRMEVMELHFALAALHAIVVNVNIHLAPPELAHQLVDADPSAIFAEPEFEALLKQALSLNRKTNEQTYLIWTRKEDPFDLELAPAAAQTHYSECVTPGAVEIVENHVEAMEEVFHEEDIFHMYYTSGTTGKAKGATLSHRIVYLHAEAAIQGVLPCPFS